MTTLEDMKVLYMLDTRFHNMFTCESQIANSALVNARSHLGAKTQPSNCRISDELPPIWIGVAASNGSVGTAEDTVVPFTVMRFDAESHRWVMLSWDPATAGVDALII
jgi:hypothetical protein